MNRRPLPGTIDHPTSADPEKQAPMNPSDHDPRSHAGHRARPLNRTLEVQLLPEALARAHVQTRLYEAESERSARQLNRAVRLQRRAERATLRARRALAHVVMN